jgi:tetratricopeptide (TPR) repeat protein
MFVFSLAIVCEGAALAAAFALKPEPVALASYLALHAVASALVAKALVRLLPAVHLDRARPARVFFFAVSFFLPVVGMAGMFGMAIMARLTSARGPRRRFELHPAPIYNPRTGEAAARSSKGRVRVQLANIADPTEARLRALLAVQSMPARMANPLIREMLVDPSEDLRLIAYGILDTREKAIHARIHAATQRLEAAGAAGRATLHKRLAELYCELVYQRLVHGDLREHATAQARAHVERALAIDPRDPALHALVGQIALSAGEYRSAQLALARALDLGLAESRVLPYLAEAAFRLRRFDEVRAVARRLASLPNTPPIEHIVQYWKLA